MMTGQILSGESPSGAIKYQMAIWIAIVTSTTIGIVLATLLSARVSLMVLVI
jgi:ABC-type iron transport system FetAB permease component